MPLGDRGFPTGIMNQSCYGYAATSVLLLDQWFKKNVLNYK